MVGQTSPDASDLIGALTTCAHHHLIGASTNPELAWVLDKQWQPCSPSQFPFRGYSGPSFPHRTPFTYGEQVEFGARRKLDDLLEQCCHSSKNGFRNAVLNEYDSILSLRRKSRNLAGIESQATAPK